MITHATGPYGVAELLVMICRRRMDVVMGPFEKGWTEGDVEKIIREGKPAELVYVPIVVSMDPPDGSWAMHICLQLAKHSDQHVRGNAILGFGHLSRTLGDLDEAKVRPVLEEALTDSSEYVRSQAVTAASDISHFLGWIFRDPCPPS